MSGGYGGSNSVGHLASIADDGDAPQAIAAGLNANVAMSTVTLDTDGFYVSPGVFRAALGAGLYRVTVRGSVGLGVPAPNAGNQSLYINYGPGTIDPDARAYYAWNDPADDKNLAATVELAAGDQVTFEVVNNTNGQLVVNHGGGQRYWRATIEFLG